MKSFEHGEVCLHKVSLWSGMNWVNHSQAKDMQGILKGTNHLEKLGFELR
jgi:hypothetical protein